jgi:hypothetical protein
MAVGSNIRDLGGGRWGVPPQKNLFATFLLASFQKTLKIRGGLPPPRAGGPLCSGHVWQNSLVQFEIYFFHMIATAVEQNQKQSQFCKTEANNIFMSITQTFFPENINVIKYLIFSI